MLIECSETSVNELSEKRNKAIASRGTIQGCPQLVPCIERLDPLYINPPLPPHTHAKQSPPYEKSDLLKVTIISID